MRRLPAWDPAVSCLATAPPEGAWLVYTTTAFMTGVFRRCRKVWSGNMRRFKWRTSDDEARVGSKCVNNNYQDACIYTGDEIKGDFANVAFKLLLLLLLFVCEQNTCYLNNYHHKKIFCWSRPRTATVHFPSLTSLSLLWLRHLDLFWCEIIITNKIKIWNIRPSDSLI